MTADSGEDITDDAQRPEAAAAAQPGPLGGFNLSQLLQDAFSGIAGLGGGPQGAATTSAGECRSCRIWRLLYLDIGHMVSAIAV